MIGRVSHRPAAALRTAGAGDRTVIQVVDSLRLGGTERMSVDLSNGLVAGGWTVHLVLTREAGPLAEDLDPQVQVHNLARRSRWDVEGLRSLRDLVRDACPAIVHVHGWSSLRFATAALLGFRNAPPFVLHDHGGARYSAHPRLYKLVAWPFVRAHLAVGQSLLEPPLPMRRRVTAKVIANGIPLERVRPKTDFTWGDPPRLVVVGNLREQKDHVGLLDAMGRLHRRGIDVRLDLIGATPDDGIQRGCRELVSSLGLEEMVNFRGRVSDVGSELAAYDLGIISSQTESGPIALIEYLAAGLPFVSTDVGEIPARLPPSLRRWVVPPSAPDALAEKVAEALAVSSVEREAIGSAELDFAPALSIGRTVEAVDEVYRLLATHR